jgi:adenosylcobinamide-phosphate synthase
MAAVERVTHRDRRDAGMLHAGLGAAIGLGVGLVSPTAAATYIAVAGRALAEAALEIDDALDDGDLDRARELLPALVGRDPRDLDEGDVCRAVVESVAENTVDAVVAPALWAMVAGGPGVLGYRAVNTLDAMVGHRSPRYENFGWASARLDDAANFVPARVTAGLVALARPRRASAVQRAVLRDAPSHPSPNAGVSEAAFAAALGLRLGGESRYDNRIELRPTLGDGRSPARRDIARAVRLSSDVQWLLTGMAVALPW